MEQIAPVLVLSTGRCGSTMISDVLNLHPEILSLSEVFSTLGPRALFRNRISGEAMWALCSRQNPGLRVTLSSGDIPSEILYPLGTPQARFSPQTVPPILCTTLPHLTPCFESLYDELEPVVRTRPRQSLRNQYLFLFEWLRTRFGRRLWIERSGGSLLSVPRLRRLFPEARVIHVYRDGRDTALSMSRHPAFKAMLATIKKMERMGLRPLETVREAGPVSSALALLFLTFVDPGKMMAQEFDLSAYGDLWSRMILRGRRLLSLVPAGRFLSLSYEDMVSRPQEKLRELIEFIDPSLTDETWLDKASLLPRPNPSTFRSLDPETQWRLTRACEPGLKALGYAV